MQVIYDEAKFAEMVLLIAGRLRDDRAGGPTKLTAALYFADFAHVRLHRRPISGAEYVKVRNGASPRPMKSVRSQLIAGGAAAATTEQFLGYPQRRLVPRRDADLSVFEASELATMESVLADLAPLNAKQVIDLLREERGWIVADEGDVIPYHMAFSVKEQISTPTSRRLAGEVAERFGIAVGQ